MRFPCSFVGSARRRSGSRGSGRPQPQSLLLPAAAAGWPSLPPPPLPGMLAPRRCLLSCLRPLCRSPAPAYSSAAASGPARPSPTQLKSGGERGEERVRTMPSYPKRLLLARGRAGSSTASRHGDAAPRLFPSLTGPGKGQRRREVEDTALSAANPQTEPPGTPKGLQ